VLIITVYFVINIFVYQLVDFAYFIKQNGCINF